MKIKGNKGTIKTIRKSVILIIMSLSLVLVGCTSKEERELEMQKKIEEESNKKATEMAKKYEEERNKSRVSPYSVNDMDANFGKKYKEIRDMIDIFNNDLKELRDGNITVYDINKKISDYRLKLKEYQDVEELKIPDDYFSFYTDFLSEAESYVNNLESLGDAFQMKDGDLVEESVDLLAQDIESINNVEFSIFGSPLADKIFSGTVKERSDKKLKNLCTIKINDKNKEYLDSIALPEVDKTKMSEEELMERISKEEEYIELIKKYESESKKDKEDCYSKVMEERSTFGNRVVESENSDLESELMETLDKYEERKLEEEAQQLEDEANDLEQENSEESEE